ncbi:aldo/keto reductase [Gordonia sp. ABSL1-1]|uniref:aldo/keto reductase n=1 Tax=Gordonia sp. ABSL1-1 TaxID=3053923 RepID=UPI0025736D04|nr:aldo/keto reductase [Gordonia sp. ABSL1-1]MDL9936325.1 aldo/keto reductase [Gordonia sp. ABSL1-1]
MTSSSEFSFRSLGIDGPKVGPVGLGCMGMSSTYQSVTDAACRTTLQAAVDAGVTHFDTADMYGQGHNETLVGTTLTSVRDDVVIATKFGYRFDDSGGRTVDSTATWTRTACDESLRRLHTDYIDLYYLHRRDPGTPIEETMSALADLVQAGKVRHLGLSEVSPGTLRRAHAIAPISAVQMEYSLFTRDVEAEMLDTCRELGVALVAYAPVGRGWLSGAVRSPSQLEASDGRRVHPRFADAAFETNTALVDVVRSIGTEIGATPAQVALAWLLGNGDDILAIPGTTVVAHLHENLAATEIHLDTEQRSRLDHHLAPGAAAGARHTAANLSMVGH